MEKCNSNDCIHFDKRFKENCGMEERINFDFVNCGDYEYQKEK